ncbi:uncharacterized protein FOBCDRAFT_258660 [Fusarium oxysporum Fo47]|uniref:uncharacterized protein n=1 Tax=Fusarium oxysporum Fo47 TaxID=660027 RepID=UPI002869AB8F|nr:uncharacterized protein FOBCDRAFT_258660 [Fusarium oxysporum Fo47]QKD51543.2 hypothetical protein FOBCDRAFT_258660 [Fusarium oxysporum Fo47]
MPTLIEGNTGAIKGIHQPLAMLMHRYDGTTMRDSVYEHMILNKFDGTAQARTPRESIDIPSNVSMAPNTINTTSANTFTTANQHDDVGHPDIEQYSHGCYITTGSRPKRLWCQQIAVEGNFAVGVHYQAVYGKTAWEPPLERLNSLYQHRLGQEFMVVIHILMGNQYYIFLLAHTVYRPPDVLTHSTYACRALTGLVTTSMYRNGSSSPISRLLFFLSIVSKDEVFMIAHRGRGAYLSLSFTAVYSEYAEDDIAYQKNTVMSVQKFMTRFSRLDRQSTRATQGALNERLRIVATLPKPYTMKHTMLPVIRRRTTGGIVVSDDHNAANNDIDTELDLDPARSELSNLAQPQAQNLGVQEETRPLLPRATTTTEASEQNDSQNCFIDQAPGAWF